MYTYTRSRALVRWLVVGPAAVVAIAALLVGAPWALLVLAGNPLPGGSLSQLGELLTTVDDGRLLLWALSVVGWLAWAAVASSLLLELGAQVAGRRTPHVPGLSGPQRLASLLVAAALASLSSPAVASAAYVDTEIHASYLEPEGLPAGLGHGPQDIVHTVQRGEGLVDIAERYGVSVEQLAIANHHRPQSDGLSLRPGELRVYSGWQLRIPATGGQGPGELRIPATADQPQQLVHEVAKGDWMWHVAGRYLGDELRYPEIAALNPELAEKYPDYPDHIQPGDLLVLPEDAQDSGERGHATGDLIGEPDTEPEPEPPPEDEEEEPPPETATPEPPAQTPTPTPAPPAQTPTPASPDDLYPDDEEELHLPPEPPAPPPQTPSPAAPVQPSPVHTPSPTPAGPPAQAAPGEPPPAVEPPPAAVPAPEAEPAARTSDLAPDTGALVAAGVLASVLLGAILLFRWRKHAHRRPGRIVTDTAYGRAESALRGAATADTARLDQALRLLTEDRHAPPPDAGAVWVAGGDIHLIMTDPPVTEPPLPFHNGDSGTWVLPAHAELPEPAGGVAPLPGLVTIASHPGEHLLVDLERLGMLTIAGDPERTTDLLRHLVAELACNPWSELVSVTMVGFPPEEARQLVAFNPDRIRHMSSLPDAVEAIRRRLVFTTGALDGHGLPDALYGRVRDTATDTWVPQLLLINQPGPEHDELLSYLEATLTESGRRCAVAVATATGRDDVPYGRRPVLIDEYGLLTASFLDNRPIPAAGLPAALLPPLVALVRDAATGPDHPVPPATEAWAAGTDAAGGHTTSDREALVGDTPVRPFPTITAEDPALDEAVAQWWHGGDQPPRLALLGPVEVTGPGQPPSQRVRVCQELVALLAARGDAGADAGEITRLLWPQQQVPATARTEVIMNVRRWLSTDPDGEQWLSEAVPDGRYRLRDGLLVDWHLFRRLRTRGERRGADGTADLGAALCLVRGAPLADTDQLGGAGVRVPYSWLPGSAFAPELILSGVLDTAHRLVELCLAAGDLETARWAVQRAWLADPRRTDDLPWHDLLRIADAGGDPGQVRVVVAELLGWRGVDDPDELAPATRELIAALLAGVDG